MQLRKRDALTLILNCVEMVVVKLRKSDVVIVLKLKLNCVEMIIVELRNAAQLNLRDGEPDGWRRN